MNAKKMLKLKSTKTADLTPAAGESGTLNPVVGARVAPKQLRYQALKLIGGARSHQAELTDAGYPPTMTAAVVTALALFEACTKEKEAFKLQTLAYDSAVQSSLDVRGKLAADLRVAAVSKPEVLVAMPLNLGKVNGNGFRLTKWFTDVQGLMEALRPELARVSSVDWFAELASEQAKLNQVLGTHAGQRAKRAQLSRKRLAARNALAIALQTLQAYAGKAFRGQPEVLKEFQKATGVKRKAKAADTASEPSPATPAQNAGATPAAAPAAPAQPAVAAQPKPLLN